MSVALKNGRIIIIEEAKRWRCEDDELVVYAARNRELARFRLDAVAGWWFDCEEVTTYGVNDEVLRPE